MKDKKVVAGVVIGVAALAVAGILFAYKNKSKKRKVKDFVENAADRFHGKLNKLQKKAKKEYRTLKSDGEEFVNGAKERASGWADKANIH